MGASSLTCAPSRPSWESFGNGTGGEVDALTFDVDGNLWAAGNFSTAGGFSARGIAGWDGMNWTTLGSGTNGQVFALAFDGAGDLYAGGNFTTAGSKPSLYIAWNYCPHSVDVEPQVAPGTLQVLAWPNPFSDKVELTFSGSTLAPVQMEAFDVRGRRVWTSPVKIPGLGGTSFTWDGSASGSARLGQGVYFVRATDAIGRVLASRAVVRLN